MNKCRLPRLRCLSRTLAVKSTDRYASPRVSLLRRQKSSSKNTYSILNNWDQLLSTEHGTDSANPFGVDSPPTSEILVRLVAARQYAAADRMRLLMLGSHIHIENHPIFEWAALEALSSPIREKRSQKFLAWLEHYPDAKELPRKPSEPYPLHHTRNFLLHSGMPSMDLHIILPFALLCASKGFFGLIQTELLSLLVDHASPREGKQFLLELERVFESWKVRYNKVIPANLDRAKCSWRMENVRTCCDAGWYDEALELCLESTPTGFGIPKETRRRIREHYMVITPGSENFEIAKKLGRKAQK